MIVNPLENGWEIIFQRNHALVAGALAQNILAKHRPPYWTETLAAILDHDDGEANWSEDRHITDAGRPMDFTMYEFDLEQASKVVDQSKYKSKWISLLVSMHTTSLYSPVENKSKELRQFLKDQEGFQQELRNYFGISKQEMSNYYSFLRWCDECSLILCQNRLIHEDQKVEIGQLRNIKASYIYKHKNKYHIEPWCFSDKQFSVQAEVYTLSQMTFKNTDELKSKLDETAPKVRVWEFQKPS